MLGEKPLLTETAKIRAVRNSFQNKKRIVVKIGSSSITHPETGALNFSKLEVLVRQLSDVKNGGKEVILVSSGAIAVGRHAIRMKERPKTLSVKQACAAIGQATLMMTYQKLFAEYGHNAAQILMTRANVDDTPPRINVINTFQELFNMDVIPVVNENDTVSTYEIQFGDNDTLSAVVASLIHADLLILFSDIDGLYTDDPRTNPGARFLPFVDSLDDELLAMGKGAGSTYGTGGMATKLHAAQIAMDSGCDMVIASGDDFHILSRILGGEDIGTLFASPIAQRSWNPVFEE